MGFSKAVRHKSKETYFLDTILNAPDTIFGFHKLPNLFLSKNLLKFVFNVKEND